MDLLERSSIEPLLVGIVWSRRDKLVEIADKSFRTMNRIQRSTPPQEIENWIDGFVALLIEALQSGGTTYRKFYLERLVSDMTFSGIHPQLLFQLSVAWSILVTNEIVQAAPESERPEAVRWFSTFFASYISDMSILINGQSSEPPPNASLSFSAK